MKWNPYLQAIAAEIYIFTVGSIIQYISKLHHDTPDNLFGTMTALSLVTLSAAVMCFIFFYRPVTLLIDNKKKEATIFFLKTIITFAVITSIFVTIII